MKRETKVIWRAYAIRLVIVTVISFALVAVFNEVAFAGQKDAFDRAPDTVQLLIPEGTAERVAAGERVPAIPEEMVFVVGDTLEVINDDQSPHQLGPLWVPAGGTALLKMEQAERIPMACSFQNTQYLGIDVRQPTTWGTRITGLLLAGPTTAVLVFLYTIVMWPVKPKPVVPTA